ncbi:MAG: pyrroloquinoline quinone biosynthesis peptide chaperone PqqD [Paracoccaceae bacterium]
MDSADIPTLPRGVRLHFDKVRDKWVLLAPERAVTLDPIGHAILSEVDGARSFGEIAQALADKYNAPADQIAADSAGFLNALRDRRFLDVSL